MMRVSRQLVVAALAVLALAGCATSKRDQRLSYNPTNFSTPDELPIAQTLTTYRLGAGDTVSVAVFGVDSLSGEQQIDAAGNVTMPLIGPVPAAGLTTQELGVRLAAQLNQRYLQRPQVVVALKNAVAKTVTVDGSVGAPGLYPVMDRTSLLKTIAMAHGASEGANLKKVVVFRQIKGERQAAAFDLTTIRDGVDPDPAIYPNDVVIVDGRDTNNAWRNIISAVPLIGLFARF